MICQVLVLAERYHQRHEQCGKPVSELLYKPEKDVNISFTIPFIRIRSPICSLQMVQLAAT